MKLLLFTNTMRNVIITPSFYRVYCYVSQHLYTAKLNVKPQTQTEKFASQNLNLKLRWTGCQTQVVSPTARPPMKLETQDHLKTLLWNVVTMPRSKLNSNSLILSFAFSLQLLRSLGWKLTMLRRQPKSTIVASLV